jgi:hypothetical protein
VEAAEDELVDRYVWEELEAHERRRFEERLMASERIHQRVRTARTLRRIADREPASGTAPNNGSVLGRLLPLPSRAEEGTGRHSGSPSQWLAWAACIVALVASGGLAFNNLHLQDQLTTEQEARQNLLEQVRSAEEQSEKLRATVEEIQAGQAELTRLREQLVDREKQIANLEDHLELSARSAVAGTAAPSTPQESIDSDPIERTTLLLALATREDEVPVLQLPVQGSEVELQLDLDRYQVGDHVSVAVRRSEFTIWSESGVKPQFFGPEGMVSVILPVECLLPGIHEVTIMDPARELGDHLPPYKFVVHPDPES